MLSLRRLGKTSAALMAVLLGTNSAFAEVSREIIIYDDFRWDYAQDFTSCHFGAALGYDFCGYDNGWKPFSDRTTSFPPAFSYSEGSDVTPLQSWIESGQPGLIPMTSLDASIADVVSTYSAIPEFDIEVVAKQVTKVGQDEARSFLLLTGKSGTGAESLGAVVCFTIWDHSTKSEDGLSNLPTRYSFISMGSNDLEPSRQFEIHLAALSLIKEYSE